jgi:hypothetical protein
LLGHAPVARAFRTCAAPSAWARARLAGVRETAMTSAPDSAASWIRPESHRADAEPARSTRPTTS